MNYLIYAFYDRDGIIDFHVVESLLKYNKFFKIIFVSNIKLGRLEKNKINFVTKIIENVIDEKDFGCWKVGINFLNRKKVKNLILTNDSVVGPYEDTSKITAKMDKNDFWGITSAGQGENYHIQSYFLFFKSNVVKNSAFKSFFSNVKKQKSKSDLVKFYEIGLTQLLIKEGFKCNSYLETSKRDIHSTEKCLDLFLKNYLPFFKVKNFVSNPYRLKKINRIFDKLKNEENLIKYIKRINKLNDVSHLFYVLPQFKFFYISKKLFFIRAKFVSNNKMWRFYIKFMGIYIFFIIFPVKSGKYRLYSSKENY